MQSSLSSTAAEHIQPSLDITPWDTRRAQPASNAHLYDKRLPKRFPRARRGLWVRLTLAGAASCSLAAPALAVDRKVGAGPFPALSVSAMHG